ncbi:hypothetical protein CGT93_01150 [Vibrio metoecus]|nr:hypothetical protein CGT93_01150 [Vibrio metoecus]
MTFMVTVKALLYLLHTLHFISLSSSPYGVEKGRQTRNPNRSNARYSLSKPIAIDSLETEFALFDLIEQTETNGEKVNNYALVKQVGIEVDQRNTEEEWDVAYKRRVVSVAADAIKSVIKGVFPNENSIKLDDCSLSEPSEPNFSLQVSLSI